MFIESQNGLVSPLISLWHTCLADIFFFFLTSHIASIMMSVIDLCVFLSCSVPVFFPYNSGANQHVLDTISLFLRIDFVRACEIL